MPGWLTIVCCIAVIAACAYLLYVILRPDRF
ncbi:potassium-transporting ATPase subunit F [Solilutibacter silvestris]|uniref:K+-transporting ATPase n=1 Tax=Solilutibacter silvestris TaxID=1645665 RepID=A0A2K1PZ82_9GAMM|nr:potassium-transporting ATPase subunit F [Lysobacter silvestris]PNS08102.1 K+-transporting ATPase [Lysobacter silvestris]